MNAVVVVRPRARNLLCLWHINKNVVRYCKMHFRPSDNWESFLELRDDVCLAANEDHYQEAYAALESITPIGAMEYLESTRLCVKEITIAAWTNKCCHYGTAADLPSMTECNSPHAYSDHEGSQPAHARVPGTSRNPHACSDHTHTRHRSRNE